ncbi:MAG: outer membrane beta-barrel protein, partial [Halioglobus sp.]
DQQVNLDLHHEFNAKHQLDVFGEYYDGHEKRGTGLTDGFGGLVDAPVEYVRETYGGIYTYGNNSSRGRLRLEAKSADYDFKNFRSFTRFRDREQDTLSGTFFWKIASRTDALVQVRAIDNKYDHTSPFDSFGSFDSEEYNYLVGITWEATAKTKGSVKIGAYDREYDSSARDDDDGFQWEVDLTYMPRTYSAIKFETRRYSQETNGRGDSIDTQEYSLAWDHNWSGRSSTKFLVLTGTEDYSGIDRKDDRFDIEASYSYSAQRWLDLGAGFRREDRDSDDRLFDYKRNVIFIEANVSL